MTASQKTLQRHDRWKCDILHIIRSRQDASRTLIRRETGLSMDVTLTLVEELLREGLILSAGKSEGGGAGRKATYLTIDPDGCYFIGLRFSAGGMTGVCVNFALEPVARETVEIESPPDADELVEQIAACVLKLADALGDRRGRIRGVGIGAPGLLDPEAGVIIRYAHIPSIRRLPLARLLEERLPWPVLMDHGVKCRTRAVLSDPDCAGSSALMFLQMGRGLNLCMAADGRILNGADYMSGEIGHVRVAGNARRCACGLTGCLETLASDAALCDEARRRLNAADFSLLRQRWETGERITVPAIVKAAEEGCPGCARLLGEAGRAVGETLASAVVLFNPDTLLISGAAAESADFRAMAGQALKDYCLSESFSGMRLDWLQADSGQDALGAALLPYRKLFEPQER